METNSILSKSIGKKFLGLMLALFLIFGSFGATLASALEGFEIKEPNSDLQLNGNYKSPKELMDGDTVECGVWYVAKGTVDFYLSDSRVGYYVAESYGNDYWADSTFCFGNYTSSWSGDEITYHNEYDFLCGMYLTEYDFEYGLSGRIETDDDWGYETVFRITYTGDTLPGIPDFSDNDTDSGLYKYATVADQAFFTGVTSDFSGKTLNIPATIDGYQVVGISNDSVPSSVTTVNIPASVNTISPSAFDSAKSLKTANVNAENKYFESYNGALYTKGRSELIAVPRAYSGKLYLPASFGEADLQKFVFSDAVSFSIDKSNKNISYSGGVFYNADKTRVIKGTNSVNKNYTMPKTVKTIADSAFASNSALESVSISSSVTSISYAAFLNCKSLKSVTLPNGIKTIGGASFGGCTSIKSVTIPDTVTHIQDCAFSLDKSLTSLTIGKGVKNIGSSAFYNCVNLKSVYIKDLAKWFGITFEFLSSNPLQYADSLYLNNKLLENITVPNSVKEIKSRAFYGFKGLKSLKVSDSVTYIGSYAFSNCKGLTSVTIPNSVTEICDSAFLGCTSLKSLTIPNSVTEIGYAAFQGCTGLTSVTIPNSVSYIGHYAFDDCTSLTTVKIGSGLENFRISVFEGCKKLATINVSTDNKKYSSVNGVLFNKNKTEIIMYPPAKNGNPYSIPSTVKTVGNCAFNDSTGLTSVNIPNSVTEIAYYSFEGCENLKTVTIPNSVKRVGERAFLNCKNLKTMQVGKNADISCCALGYYNTDGDYWNYKKVSGFTIYGISGSPAQTYAKENGFKFVNVTKPGTVKLSGATNASTGVKVSWSKVDNISSYTLYRKSGNSGWKAIKSNIIGTSYTDTTAKSGTKYTYTVRATNVAGTGGYDKTGKTVTYLAMPKPSVSNASNGVTVKWSKVTGAKEYYVYRKSGNSGWKKIGTSKGTSYTDKNVKSGTTYTYTVRAYNGKTSSSYNTKGLTIKFLATPKLSSVTSAKSGVTLKWGKVTGASGYYVYRKNGNSGWSRIATVSGNSKVSYLDKSAKKGTTYTYTVRAYNGKTLSAYNTQGLKIKDKY